jgi:3-deoxy-D-manno-octulosonate 8-phosphate phosphatase (KDO 8-P phosphatase)
MTYLDKLQLEVKPFREKLTQTKLVAFDVDGVLTNGELHYSASGEATKVFHVRDGVGLKLLADIGIVVAIISAKKSEMLERRISELGVKEFVLGAKNKLVALSDIAARHSIALSECCFVGDDVVDIKPMKESGVSFAPSNAYPLVCEVADCTLNIRGGEGVARKVADYILVAQKKFESAYQIAGSEKFERDR